MIIKLYNRDHANMYLEKIKDNDDNTSTWELKVDKKHKYCLEYMRCGGDFDVVDNKVVWKERKMIDPSGGPYLEVGDIINNKYKIVEIIDYNILRLSEEISNN